jgi:hypothetical protein
VLSPPRHKNKVNLIELLNSGGTLNSDTTRRFTDE